MRKSLSSLWLKSFKRISKVQQRQGRDLLQSLLGTPAPAKRKRVGAVKKVLTSIGLLQAPGASRAAVRSKPAKAAKPAKPPRLASPASSTPKLRSSAHKPVKPRGAEAQGQWLRSFYLELADGLAPPRRMDYWLFVPSRPAAE